MLDTAFFDTLRIASVQWDLEPGHTDTRTRGGESIRIGFAQPRWVGVVTIKSVAPRQMAPVKALLRALDQPGRYLLAHDPDHCGPLADPGGVILGAAEPKIATLGGDGFSLTLSGLPAGYVLSVGDHIGWVYGSDPDRYAMHQLETSAVANGAGVTGEIRVVPAIRPGVTAQTPVNLVRPKIKCTLSKRMGVSRALADSPVITLTQTLR